MEKSTPCDTLVLADTVITQNDSRDVLRQAALAITDGRIAAIGQAPALTERFAPAQTIDLGESLVLPGLVNSHGHAAMTLFRGLSDDAPLAVWLKNHIWPAEARLTPEATRLGTTLACAEMLASGTTCFLDAYLFADTEATAVEACGLRAVICQGVFDRDEDNFKATEHALATAADLADRLAGHPRLRTAIFPHAVYTCSADTLVRCITLARSKGLLLSTHAAETAKENADCESHNGARVIPYLHRLGLLGHNTLLAHCVDLNEADRALLAATDTAVAHCPKSNMKLASGVAPIQALRTAGVRVALGTDGAASNNALNLFSEMSAAALLQKVTTGNPTALNAQAVLDMATRDGAEALGWPELGRLAVGGPADLCALDMTRPGLSPAFDPVSNVVYAASGGEVRLTMVAGRVLYRDGRFPELDYPGLRTAFHKAAADLTGQAS